MQQTRAPIDVTSLIAAEPGVIDDTADRLQALFATTPQLAELVLPYLASGDPARIANARLLLTLFDESALLSIARGFMTTDPTARNEILGVLWAHLIGTAPNDRQYWLESIAPYLRTGLVDEAVPERGYADPERVEIEHVYRVCDETYLFLNRLLDQEFDDSQYAHMEELERTEVVQQFNRRFDNLFASPAVAARKAARNSSGLAELTIVASFPDPYGGQDTQEERDKSTQSKWAPSTRDFLAVAAVDTPDPGRAIFEVHQFMEMISAILFVKPAEPAKSAFRPKQSIRRINIITHGNPGLIAMSGTVDKTGVVMLRTRAPGGDDLSGPIDVAAVQAAMNPLALLPNNASLLQSLRDRMTADAEIFLYACHSGMGGSLPLIQDINRLFMVRVRAFRDEIAYCPQINASRIIDRAFTAIGNCNAGSSRGFKHLKPDITVGKSP